MNFLWWTARCRDAEDHASALAKFDEISAVYDERVAKSEQQMGIDVLRRELVQNARGSFVRGVVCAIAACVLRFFSGDVLEVSCGTARNNQYYRMCDIRSLTLVDASANMLAIAKTKSTLNTKARKKQSQRKGSLR